MTPKELLSNKHENAQKWRDHVEQKDSTIWSYSHASAVNAQTRYR